MFDAAAGGRGLTIMLAGNVNHKNIIFGNVT